MEYLQAVLTSLFSAAVLFVIAKIIGYRQITELSVFDYINGITIGSIAAELAIESGRRFYICLIALVVYGTFTLVLAFLTDKSIRARRLITGTPLFLIRSGKIYDENFRTGKIDVNEFLMQCREQGYFSLSEIETALLEPNGKISLQPRTAVRPVTVSDMSLAAAPPELEINVIIDGRIMAGNLRAGGRDENWLKNEMQKQGVTDPEQVFIGTLNRSGQLSLYLRRGKLETRIFD